VSLPAIAVMLFAIGLVLILAELALPTHGVLGFMSLGCILGGIGVCFAIEPWLGGVVLLAAIVLSPVAWAGFVKIWPYTPVGRRILLPPVRESVQGPPVQPGAIGVAISELRPIGQCEFDGQRLEAQSDHGIVAAGAKVKVVNVINRRPTVRQV
jgi:membrane-bound ClpP family serine protease